MTRRRRREDQPVPLADAVAAVGDELALPDPGAWERLDVAWDGLVGPDLAAHAWPRSLRGGVLTIAVDDPAWASRIRYLDETLRGRIARLLGPAAPGEIRVVVDPDRAGR